MPPVPPLEEDTYTPEEIRATYEEHADEAGEDSDVDFVVKKTAEDLGISIEQVNAAIEATS